MIVNIIKKHRYFLPVLAIPLLLLIFVKVFHYKIDAVNYQCAVLENIVMTDHFHDAETALAIILSFKKSFRKTKDIRLIKKLSKISKSLENRNSLLNKKVIFPEISFGYLFFNKSSRSMLYTNTAMLESINSIWLLYSIKISEITSNKTKFRISKVKSIKLAAKYGKAYQKKLSALNNRIVANARLVENSVAKFERMANTAFYILLVLMFWLVVFRNKISRRIKNKLSKRKFNHLQGYKKALRRATTAIKRNKSSKSHTTERTKQNIDTDEQIVKDFVEESISDLKKLPALLQRNNKSQEKSRSALAYASRTIHKIKGDAAMLKFNEVVELIHVFEDRLILLQNKTSLSKTVLFHLTPIIKKIIASLTKINDAMKHIDRTYHKRKGETIHQFFQRMQFYANEISHDCNKTVRLIDEGFTQKDIPKKLRKDVLSLVVQLLRNAIIHGIEDAEKRLSAQKPQYGSIYIGLRKRKGSFTITVRDDGAGLDLNKIKNVAVNSGRHTRSQIKAYTSTQLINLILQPGFSTANKVGKHAGRGVGLNLVDTIVSDLGGKLSIRMRLGIFTEFSMTFPC